LLPIQVHVDENGLIRNGSVEVRLGKQGVELVRWRDGTLHTLDKTMENNLKSCRERSDSGGDVGALVTYKPNGTFEISRYDPPMDWLAICTLLQI